MARLEELDRDAQVTGVVPGEAVTIIDVRWYGASAIELTYKRRDGSLGNRILYRDDEPGLAVSESGRPWSFDADGSLFRLVAEARRIDVAHLFDPFLAVTTAAVEPLPHQITAVYEAMLPRQPLRFLLADDPGAGKTIMTGLLIRELQARGDLRRCLIVSPGSLVEQWQQEMDEKFRLPFQLLTRDRIEGSRTGNPFLEDDLLIARLDKLARDEPLQEKLVATDWDLIVFDEAHKLSATMFGDEVKKTKRRLFAERARDLTRHFLLLTATPHNGKEADFQLFLSLIDPDRFESHRLGAGEAMPSAGDTTDLMRRLMKESLVKMDGTALFPPRHAHVLQFSLSPPEADLYERVTSYVRGEMNRAERLKESGEGRRGSVVGFALTVLQRRLASSPEAIYQSLRRRRERLERNLAEAELLRQAIAARLQETTVSEGDIGALEDDETTAEETEEIEDQVVDQASAASTIEELGWEISVLRELEVEAASVRELGTDRKWSELAGLVQDSPEMHDASGSRRKLVIFTEHRDTLQYLTRKLRALVGDDEAVVWIHGGMPREQRRRQESLFKTDPRVSILVATDAAGEGINLQRAHLMVNYDLPWNPNRLEQRFGRIHRIGQTEICHLWNLVATETREGDVYGTLLAKIERENSALGGQVFDVLGRVEFGERTLRELLVEAIREGDRPEVRARLHEVIDHALDRAHLQALLRERALAADDLDQTKVSDVRDSMELASARRLQPHYVRPFFLDAFRRLGGDIVQKEPGRYEVRHVPASLRNNASTRGLSLILPRYERVVFEKDLVALEGYPLGEFLAPGHPLLDATIDELLVKHGDLLRRGGTLVDRDDPGAEPRLLVFLEHSIVDQRPSHDGRERLVSQRLEFVEMTNDGQVQAAGPAPFLDYEPLALTEIESINAVTASQTWLAASEVDGRSIGYAIETVARAHLEEVRARVDARVAKTATAVKERLTREVSFWSRRAEELERRELAGHTPKLNSRRARDRARELTERLQRRLLELEQERQVRSLPPVVVGGAVVIPQGLIDRIDGVVPDPTLLVAHQEAVRGTVMVERRSGREVEDVSQARLGFDVLSRGPDGPRFIKVVPGSTHLERVRLSRTAVMTALNTGTEFRVALADAGTRGIRFATPAIDGHPPFDQSVTQVSLGATPDST